MVRSYPGRTHRFYTGTPVYKFGDGLSYTTFTHRLSVLPGLAEVHIPRSESAWDNNDVVATTLLVHVANTGLSEWLHGGLRTLACCSRSFDCGRSVCVGITC